MEEERVLLITTRECGESERRVYLREAEMRSLIETLSLPVVFQKSFTIKGENRASLFGSGQIEEMREIADALDATERESKMVREYRYVTGRPSFSRYSVRVHTQERHASRP